MKNREEGFTLVELLAVIVILGIILAIAIPSIGNVITRARTSTQESEQALVVDAARIYFTDASFDGAPPAEVTVDTLRTQGFLDDRESDIADTAKVTRTDTGELTFVP